MRLYRMHTSTLILPSFFNLAFWRPRMKGVRVPPAQLTKIFSSSAHFNLDFFHLGLPLEEKWRILAVGQNESQSFFALPHVPHPPTIVIIVRLHAAV